MRTKARGPLSGSRVCSCVPATRIAIADWPVLLHALGCTGVRPTRRMSPSLLYTPRGEVRQWEAERLFLCILYSVYSHPTICACTNQARDSAPHCSPGLTALPRSMDARCVCAHAVCGVCPPALLKPSPRLVVVLWLTLASTSR